MRQGGNDNDAGHIGSTHSLLDATMDNAEAMLWLDDQTVGAWCARETEQDERGSLPSSQDELKTNWRGGKSIFGWRWCVLLSHCLSHRLAVLGPYSLSSPGPCAPSDSSLHIASGRRRRPRTVPRRVYDFPHSPSVILFQIPKCRPRHLARYPSSNRILVLRPLALRTSIFLRPVHC